MIHMHHMLCYFVHKILVEEFVYEICIPYLIKGVKSICYACVCIVNLTQFNSVHIMSDNFLTTWQKCKIFLENMHEGCCVP